MKPMFKFDYVLLTRHFRGTTSDDEDREIASWEGGAFLRGATYQRLLKLQSNNDESLTILKREETKIWKKILTKLFEDEELKDDSLQNQNVKE